jgi:hypothetical protein
MSAYLQSISAQVWEICLDATYVVLAKFDETNSKARNALFMSLSSAEFDPVSNLKMVHEIYSILERYHKGTSHIKTRLFETPSRV